MKTKLTVLVIVLATLIACNNQPKETADTIYTNGKIYTVNEAQPWAEAVAIKDGKFLKVGTTVEIEALQGDNTTVVDLEGKTVLPGFIDLHNHLLTYADGTSHLSIKNTTDVDAMLAEIKVYAETNPGIPIIKAERWDLGVFPGDSPRKELLDAIISDRPVFLMSQSGHSAWVNSKALEMAGINKNTPITKKFVFDKDPETGEPSGTIREYAMAHVLQALPKTSPEQMVSRIEELSYSFSQAGFTTLKLAEGRPNIVEAAVMVEKQDKLTVRLFPSWEWESHYNEFTDKEMSVVIDNWKDYQTDLIEPRYIKIFADGSPDSFTSLLYDDYEGRPGFKGATHRPKEALLKAITEFNAMGLGVIIHALGDATAGQVVDVFTEVSNQENFNAGAVLQLSHAWMMNSEDMERLSKLKGVSIDFSPILCYRHPVTEFTFVPPVGEVRYQKMFNVRSAIDYGLPVGFGSDYPSMLIPEVNAFHQMQSWITRVDPEKPESEPLNPTQRITLEEVIKGFTHDGAVSLGFDWPEKLGSIEEGKLADFIVIDRNIFDIPIETLYQTKVLNTFVNGKEVYSDK